jgi:hypothetical protein
MVPGSSAAEQTVVSRQVDGSNPFSGSHVTIRSIFKSCTLVGVMGIGIIVTISWWGLLLWLAVRHGQLLARKYFLILPRSAPEMGFGIIGDNWRRAPGHRGSPPSALDVLATFPDQSGSSGPRGEPGVDREPTSIAALASYSSAKPIRLPAHSLSEWTCASRRHLSASRP